MSTTDLLADGSIVLRTLARPSTGLASLPDRPRLAVALLASTVLALASAAVVVPHTDYGQGEAPAADDTSGQPPAEPTEYEQEQRALTARKLGELGDWAGAALLPSLLAAGAAAALALGFRLAGARAAYRPALAVAAHGMVPLWIARLLAVPGALARAPVPRAEVAHLLPSSPAALLGPDAPPALAGALSGLDLFALWAVWLVALGMAKVTGASRARALVTTLALYLAWVAVVRVALPSLAAGQPGPR
jgi:hypothetical protein